MASSNGHERAIDLDRLGKVFPGQGGRGDFVALGGVTLTVQSGEFCCLLGPSGCGKTTVLNLIAGFDTPSAGRVSVLGEPVQGPSRTKGVIFQTERALFDWLTVEENVEFGLRMAGLPRGERKSLVERNLSLVGLLEHRTKLPRELSGGMKQRVQIARVLANDPAILLMDEPFAALDAHTRHRMQLELARIWEATGKTVLFVTHDIAEAIWLGDRIAVMTRGPAAKISKTVEVGIRRPRERMTPDFIELYNALDSVIQAEATGG